MGIPLQFLQPFSIDSAGFPCRDPAIPSPHSFHGVKICIVALASELVLVNRCSVQDSYSYSYVCLYIKNWQDMLLLATLWYYLNIETKLIS